MRRFNMEFLYYVTNLLTRTSSPNNHQLLKTSEILSASHHLHEGGSVQAGIVNQSTRINPSCSRRAAPADQCLPILLDTHLFMLKMKIYIVSLFLFSLHKCKNNSWTYAVKEARPQGLVPLWHKSDINTFIVSEGRSNHIYEKLGVFFYCVYPAAKKEPQNYMTVSSSQI